jgi:hypothetical protein
MVDDITQIEKFHNLNRDLKADNLIRETKILNIARLAKMLIDLYGQDEPFSRVVKYEGKEIELYLKDLGGYLTFILTSEKENFNCHAEKAKHPIATVIVNVKKEKILKVISDIIRSKHNIFGVIKLAKYILPRKIIIKGSYPAALKLARCLMIGKHNMYKESK